MGIGRIIILGIIIWFVWFAFKRLNSSIAIQRSKKNAEKKKKEAADAVETVTVIRQCEFCSIHVPEDEAIKQNGLYYCCQAHVGKGT